MPTGLSDLYSTPARFALCWQLVRQSSVGIHGIRKRGRYDPARPMNHMTDLTVYTEAGAAFFDGRDPYSVANPRGWHYLYPPLLAIVLAPLAKLDSQWQVVIWYFFSLAVAWGCCYESLRLLRWLLRPRDWHQTKGHAEGKMW